MIETFGEAEKDNWIKHVVVMNEQIQLDNNTEFNLDGATGSGMILNKWQYNLVSRCLYSKQLVLLV